MDPIKKSYTRFRYSQETLEKALNAIIRGETSINKASKTYNIPKSTLHNKINNKVPWQRKMGPVSQLTFEEERKLARWILNKAKVGFPMHLEEVYDTVKDFLDTNQRNTKFTNNRPGKKWLSLFLKRHQDVTKRNAELISIHVCAEENEVDPSVRNEPCSILLDENILFDTSNVSRLETTDEIVNFIIQNETNETNNYNYETITSPIPLPWYDTLPQITTNDIIKNSCDINSSITVQSHHGCEDFFSENSHNTNDIATVSSESPSILISVDNGDSEDPVINGADDADTSKITFQEKTGSIRASDDDNLDITSAPMNSTVSVSKKRKLPIESFLSFPEIGTKKKKNIKKEPMPFGLTGRKYKEYLEKIEIEKKKKEEEKENKKKEKEARIARRREFLQKKKENRQQNRKILQKKVIAPIRPQHKKKKETAQTPQNENIQKHSSTPSTICGKYVIAQFKTEKRTRCFVGNVLSTQGEKLKIDFLRKKKVVQNLVSFVKPQVEDIADVHISDIVRILGEPNCSRRGMISFADVSFKDIE